MEQWYRQAEFQPPNLTWIPAQQLMEAQTRVGWRYFVEGFISQQWAATQQMYFNWIGKRNTGKRWASKLLKQLWTFTWEFWRLRQDQAGEPESKALAATHDELDEQIAQQFDLHTTTNST